MDINYKTKIKIKYFITGTSQPINIRYIILKLYLDRFWAKIQQLFYKYTSNNNRYILYNTFYNLFLVISKYSLKLATKYNTF